MRAGTGIGIEPVTRTESERSRVSERHRERDGGRSRDRERHTQRHRAKTVLQTASSPLLHAHTCFRPP